MICLGIESTAHTFGCGIADSKGKIYANTKHSYTSEKGGIHPSEAKLHHERFKDKIVEEALAAANLKLGDIGLISFSQGPGLPPCLIVGMKKAKELAKKVNAPLVGVNHCISHLEIGKLLTKAKDPVLLYCSGANTQVIAYEGGKYRIFGETLDNGIGNFIDAFARHIGLGFPGGPKIEVLASKGKNYIELPYTVKGMDLSFSGLLTAANKLCKSEKYSLEDICYSLQETAFAMLIEVTERAMAHTNKKEVLITGGVAANKRFCEMLDTMATERGAKAYYCPMKFAGDNGTMIAWAGALAFQKGYKTEIKDSFVKQKFRPDEVEADWV